MTQYFLCLTSVIDRNDVTLLEAAAGVFLATGLLSLCLFSSRSFQATLVAAGGTW